MGGSHFPIASSAESFEHRGVLLVRGDAAWGTVQMGANISKRSSAGFSLIEMLITLALVLIMSAMLMGRGSRSRQQRDLASCEKNLQTIYTALTIYSAENKNLFPVVTNAETSEASLSLLVPRCTTETGIFTCPGSKDSSLPQGEPFADRKISYAYYMGWSTSDTGGPLVSDRQIDTSRKKAGVPLFSVDGKGAGANHHKYGGNVLAVGGEIKRSGAQAKFDLLFPTNVVLLNPK